jgi:soluble lytic murein transglycosylase-like protein
VKPILLAVVVLVVLAGCAVRREPVDRREVWHALQPQAARYRLDPVFLYALVAAESNFDARARQGEARGLLQLTPAAWAVVSPRPYEPTVWDWRANLEAGIDYLAWCRHALHARGKFSDRLLLAAFHYGFDYVEDRDFDERRLPRPSGSIYRELWAGRTRPVPPPEAETPGAGATAGP